MTVRILTLRYCDGLQGFPEDAISQAVNGRSVLASREHFFVHAGVPHLTVVLELSDSVVTPTRVGRTREDAGKDLPNELQPLYRQLREWRNEQAKQVGIPAYSIMRNTQLAEVCTRLPRSLAELKEIAGVGEATCKKYGTDLLAQIPADMSVAELSAKPPVNGEVQA